MMAWRCSGSTNAELVDNLVRGGLLQTPRVIDAFKRVDRRFYVQDKYEAYRDSPSYIGCVTNRVMSGPRCKRRSAS